jgi:hypothetical protein
MGYNFFGNKYHVVQERQKPRRKDLDGMSPSEFKTFLKKNGFHVRRDFFKTGSVATKGSRFYRLRWWDDGYNDFAVFVVDVSTTKSRFDRWANSVHNVLSIDEFRLKKLRHLRSTNND